MSISRIWTSALVVALLASMTWIAVAQTRRDAPGLSRPTSKDGALRALARVVAVHEVHKLHWTKLEADREFKPVIERLSDELVPEELSFRWKVNVIPRRKVKDHDIVHDEFERLAVAAIQGGEDEASLIGGE